MMYLDIYTSVNVSVCVCRFDYIISVCVHACMYILYIYTYIFIYI